MIYSSSMNQFFPIRNRTPFDRNTFGGFTGVIVIYLIIGLAYMIMTILIESLFLVMGLFLQAFHLHYESMLQKINDMVYDRPAAIDTAIQLKARFIAAILFHNQSKQ